MKTILLSALALGAMGTVAMAAEPLTLSDAQMDKVTAGAAWAVYYSDGYSGLDWLWPEFAVHGHTAKFMLCISGLRIGDRVPTSTPACPHGTTFLPLFYAVTRHNVCPQTANSGLARVKNTERKKFTPNLTAIR